VKRRRTRLRGPLLLAAALAGVIALVGCGGATGGDAAPGAPTESGDAALAQAFASGAHDLEVEGDGVVARLLADDDEGARHQRFILRLGTGQTLLVAHNIDVAPRVQDLRLGDTVAFKGVYEWSEEGGTVHWTHADPDGEHVGGWLRHGGRTYR
jgi:Protein of unknown function (DUF3465)